MWQYLQGLISALLLMAVLIVKSVPNAIRIELFEIKQWKWSYAHNFPKLCHNLLTIKKLITSNQALPKAVVVVIWGHDSNYDVFLVFFFPHFLICINDSVLLICACKMLATICWQVKLV